MGDNLEEPKAASENSPLVSNDSTNDIVHGDTTKPLNGTSYYAYGFGVVFVFAILAIVLVTISNSPGVSVQNPVTPTAKVDTTTESSSAMLPNPVPIQSHINPVYHSAGNVSSSFKPYKFRPHEQVIPDKKLSKIFRGDSKKIDNVKNVPDSKLSDEGKKKIRKIVKGIDESDMRITANGIRSPHPKDDWDPPMPIPEEKDFLQHLREKHGQAIPALVSNENEAEDIFTDIIVKDVIDNPYPYFIDEGITETKRANPGCAVIYEDVIHKGHTRFVRVCLTGNSKVQTILIPTEQLSIPRKYVAVVAGKDTYISFFEGDKPVVSMGPYQFFHTNDHKYYDRIHVTFLQDTVLSNIDRTVVEITGKIYVPPPCIALSDSDPSKSSNAKVLF